MTAPRDYLDALRDILEAIDNAQAFVRKMDFEAFSRDQKTVYAVVRAIEIIGEAAKLVPDDVRKQYPQIPWRDMAGMRDKVIHGYFTIRLELVWDTVQRDLPGLREEIDRMVRELEAKEGG